MSPSPSRATESPPEPSRETLSALDISDYVSGLDGEAWALISRLFFTHGKPRFPGIAAEFGLHPGQAICLRLLDQPRAMGELATAMHCDNSNITGIVDRLEERGLVERQPDGHDRRVKLIAPTPEGTDVRDKLTVRMAEPPEPLQGLSDADLRALGEILRRALGDD